MPTQQQYEIYFAAERVERAARLLVHALQHTQQFDGPDVTAIQNAVTSFHNQAAKYFARIGFRAPEPESYDQ